MAASRQSKRRPRDPPSQQGPRPSCPHCDPVLPRTQCAASDRGLPAIVKVFAETRAGAVQHPVGKSPSPSFAHIDLVIRDLDDREDAPEARGIHACHRQSYGRNAMEEVDTPSIPLIWWFILPSG